MLSLPACHCKGGNGGANAGRTPCRGAVQPQGRGTKASRPLLPGPRGFLLPAISKGAAGRRGAGFTATATEGVGQVCLEMLRKFTARSWGQDGASPAVLQQCRCFAGSWGHSHLAKSPPCWGRHFSALPPALWSCRCLSIDSGAHRFTGDRVVAHGGSCDLYALNAACLSGLGPPQACISWGLPPPAARQCWD